MTPIDCIRPASQDEAKGITWREGGQGYLSARGKVRTISGTTGKVLEITENGGVALMVFSRDQQEPSVAGLMERTLVNLRFGAASTGIDIQAKTIEGGRGESMAVVAIRRRNG